MASSNSPFVVYALPRSRTAWLAEFLSVDPWRCHHDAAIDHGSLDAMQRFYAEPFTGSVETGAVLGWRAMRATIPGLRVAVVRRPLFAVEASLSRLGITASLGDLARKYALLDQVSEQPGVLTVTFDDLNDELACKAIFEHCLPMDFPRARWLAMRHRNIQVDMPATLTRLAANQSGIANLKAEAAALEATL